MSSHVYRCLGRTWPAALAPIAREVIPQVAARLTRHGVVLEGPGPVYEGPGGRLLTLANIVERCSGVPLRERPSLVRIYVENMALVLAIEDPLAISADVVRSSLRLRLEETATVNGWPVDRGDGLPMREDDDGEDGEDGEDDGDTAAIGAGVARLRLRRPAFPGTQWIMYLQRPGCGQPVLEEHLERWGLGVEEAWLLARRNVELLPRGTRSRQYGCWVEIDPSMFQHSRALLPATVEQHAPHGWIVGAPMRSEVVVSRVRPGFDAGIDAVTRAVWITRRRWAEGGDPVARYAWYVPPVGPGRWGEDAEPILIVDRGEVARPISAIRADPQVDIGERLHAVFGDRRPERPPPRLVI